MKISQKRTCEGCRAIIDVMNQGERNNRCSLGYCFSKNFVPSEPCPKPLTISDYIYAKEHYPRKFPKVDYVNFSKEQIRQEIKDIELYVDWSILGKKK